MLQKPKRISLKKRKQRTRFEKNISCTFSIRQQGLIEIHKESQSMSLIKFESKRSNTQKFSGQRLNYYVQTFMNQAFFIMA